MDEEHPAAGGDAPERTSAIRPAIALPVYTGSRSSASRRAASAIASRTASLSRP